MVGMGRSIMASLGNTRINVCTTHTHRWMDGQNSHTGAWVSL